MSIKQAFEKWQRANDKVNAAERAVRTARFDFQTAETQFRNAIAGKKAYIDGDDVYWVEGGELKAAKLSEHPEMLSNLARMHRDGTLGEAKRKASRK